MFKNLKKYIYQVDKRAREFNGDDGYCEVAFYQSAVKEIRNADMMYWINREIRQAINRGKVTIHSTSGKDFSDFYIFRIKTSTESSCMTILYQEDRYCNVDTIWIHGFPFGIIVALEWDIYYSKNIREFENSFVIEAEYTGCYSLNMSSFFQSLELKIW